MAARAIEILLVEDSLGDARLVMEAMTGARLNNRLHHVMNGVEALAFMRQEGAYSTQPRPDIVLLDLNMPRMDGRAVLTQVRADPKLKAIPVIALTTSSAREDVEFCYGAGANAFISKPVDFDAFLNVIHQFENFWLSVVTLP
jgi:CheY-like chemotaxis protein